MAPLRIGFVPEHFSTPLHFAAAHFSLNATLIPFPSGTGHMVTALQSGELDIALGLTEGWIAALGKPNRGGNRFKLVGTYVETPLCWAISTGAKREDLEHEMHLEGKKIGVSRVGSGSYVMGFVLADQKGWLKATGKPPFDVVPLQTFAKLRKGVNDGTADFFMWEHFTSKRYYDSGEIKRIGEIYTPWSSWKIVARDEIIGDERLEEFLEKLNLGIKHFEEHHDEAVQYVSSRLDYSAEDAREWLKTVRFAKDVRGVKRSIMEKTVETLRKAGVLEDGPETIESMAGIIRAD